MRTIKKRREPTELKEWRAASQADPSGGGINFSYDALRQSPAANATLNGLLAEQGHLCAYTGRKIDGNSAHLEHLKPQAHCKRGEDVRYDNMVACWPAPNSRHGDYGAHAKGGWPGPEEETMFVSPLNQDCEKRFVFNSVGKISAADSGDRPASTTIKKLKLDHKRLTALRGRAIEGVLGSKRNLSLSRARRRLRNIEEKKEELNSGANVQLDPYCFALKQALTKHIRVIKSAKESKKIR